MFSLKMEKCGKEYCIELTNYVASPNNFMRSWKKQPVYKTVDLRSTHYICICLINYSKLLLSSAISDPKAYNAMLAKT